MPPDRDSAGNHPGRNGSGLRRSVQNPELTYEHIAAVIGPGEGVDSRVAQRLVTEIKYEGYIARQQRVIRETKRLGMLSIPGFFTASEAFTAIHAGADYLKLFPAILGPGYVKDLKAVVKKPILAVGGVNAENLPEFMKVCLGAGIGSALYKAGKSLEALDRDAAAMVKAVK